MKITFIGCGNVGGVLADRLQRLGHEITLATSDAQSESVRKALAANAALRVAAPASAVSGADLIVLATPFQASADALKPLEKTLAGKILIDCTNPIGPGLSHGLSSQRSGTEMIQSLLPDTKVIKAFSIYGFENLADNAFPDYGVRPTMMFCGNDVTAKATVGGLLDQLEWEPLDVGGVEQALHLEHMTLLWVRMVRMGGRSPHLVWAMLTR